MRKETCFALVHSYTLATNKALGGGWCWEKYYSPDDPVALSSSEAFEIIDRLGMEMVLNDPSGQVYDLPGRPFFAKYKGWFKRVEDHNEVLRLNQLERMAQQRRRKREGRGK